MIDTPADRRNRLKHTCFARIVRANQEVNRRQIHRSIANCFEVFDTDPRDHVVLSNSSARGLQELSNIHLQ